MAKLTNSHKWNDIRWKYRISMNQMSADICHRKPTFPRPSVSFVCFLCPSFGHVTVFWGKVVLGNVSTQKWAWSYERTRTSVLPGFSLSFPVKKNLLAKLVFTRLVFWLAFQGFHTMLRPRSDESLTSNNVSSVTNSFFISSVTYDDVFHFFSYKFC